MAGQSVTPQEPVTVPLIAPLNIRGEANNLDARIINGYAEKVGDHWEIIKRPGMTIYASAHLPPGGTSYGGYGVYYYNGHVYSIQGNAAPPATLYQDTTAIGSVDVTGGVYTFSSDLGGTPVLFLHNSTTAYTYNDNTNTLTLQAAAPASMVPGQAFLDGTTYVMNSSANIRGSGINDLTTWDPLNVIVAQSEPDKGVVIAKQLTYVVAVKEWTTEAFWDAGLPAGSPLQSSQGSLFFYGCRDANSFQIFEDCMIWVTATKSGSASVLVLEGMKPRIVSTPAVERLLQQNLTGGVNSWTMRLSGHRFYCLSVTSLAFTLVYDLSTQLWFIWTTNGGAMNFCSSTFSPDRQALQQDRATGTVLKLEQTVFFDNISVGVITPISFEIYTPSWNGGTTLKKYVQRTAFGADQTSIILPTAPGLGTLQVRVSDDDYRTWSNFRNVPLTAAQPHLDSCGTFRKRAWHLRYLDQTFLRIRTIELFAQTGTN